MTLRRQLGDELQVQDDDKQLELVLEELGIGAEALIARGGEATVYRYDPQHIARVSHAGANLEYISLREDVLRELTRSAEPLSFAIPSVREKLVVQQRAVTIEPYLNGQTLHSAMADASPDRRQQLSIAALEAAHELRCLSLQRREYCDLYWDSPTRAPTWTHYLELRARRSLELAGEDFSGVDPAALAEPFDREPEQGFLHFDCCPHNILVEGTRVTAIVDFGGMCMSGDPRFDPLTAAIYLGAGSRSEDSLGVRESCREWLASVELLPWLDDAEQLVAAIWSFAQDDPAVAKWSRRVLLGQVKDVASP